MSGECRCNHTGVAECSDENCLNYMLVAEVTSDMISTQLNTYGKF